MKIKIKSLKKEDITKVAKIAMENFSGLKEKRSAEKWINCNFKAFPRMQYFVVKSERNILGYILWIEKGGFRKESVWELEQIAIKKEFQGVGVGKELIKDSLEKIKESLKKRGSKLKLIEVTTGTDNRAQKIYQKILGAKRECKIKNLFRGDEIIMIARFK